MWDEPMPKWRTAQKQHQCQGDGCAKVIAPGERYLDRALRQPRHSHGYRMFRGRNDFPNRYHQHISSAPWKNLRRKVIEQRGNRCERCGQVRASLALHHVHYRFIGSERPEDVELLCPECHAGADEARRPKRDLPQEGLIVGIDGDHWGKFDPDTIYIQLQDGRWVPVPYKRKLKVYRGT
jgi:5-methylcytosine-specific restriction endonuclease McrA